MKLGPAEVQYLRGSTKLDNKSFVLLLCLIFDSFTIHLQWCGRDGIHSELSHVVCLKKHTRDFLHGHSQDTKR